MSNDKDLTAHPSVGEPVDVTCPDCKGSGDVKRLDLSRGPDGEEFDAECPNCSGTGAIPAPSNPVADRGEERKPDGYFYEWDCGTYVRRSFDGAYYNGEKPTRTVAYYVSAPTESSPETVVVPREP